MKPHVSNIKATKNYAMFRPHGQQPQLNPKHISKLEASMAEHGFIQAKPIHCYPKNSFLYVIDGHNRLEAAKRLGLSVYYVVGDESQASLIAAENIAVRKWGTAEFVNMYTIRGHKDYVILSKYIQRGVPLLQAASLLYGENADSGNAILAIQDGTFRAKTTDRIDQIVYAMDELKDITPVVTTRIFIAALSALLFVTEFDLSQLITRIRQNPHMLSKTANREQMLVQLEDIYNFRSGKKVPLAFMAKEALQSRNIKYKRK